VPGSFTCAGITRIAAAVAAVAAIMLLAVALCVAQFVGACGEELGWRCFLQPTLGTRAGPVLTGVVVGLIWGLWHIQVIALGPAYLLGFLAGTVGMSVVLSLLLRSKGSPDLMIAGLFTSWSTLPCWFSSTRRADTPHLSSRSAARRWWWLASSPAGS
jgi:membrane protease YdiL (CAAX protease family)